MSLFALYTVQSCIFGAKKTGYYHHQPLGFWWLMVWLWADVNGISWRGGIDTLNKYYYLQTIMVDQKTIASLRFISPNPTITSIILDQPPQGHQTKIAQYMYNYTLQLYFTLKSTQAVIHTDSHIRNISLHHFSLLNY